MHLLTFNQHEPGLSERQHEGLHERPRREVVVPPPRVLRPPPPDAQHGVRRGVAAGVGHGEVVLVPVHVLDGSNQKMDKVVNCVGAKCQLKC